MRPGQAKKNQQEILNAANLINDFDDESVQKRTNSATNLAFIARALGKDRTRSELIPFLISEIIDDDDVVLLALLDNVQEIGSILGEGINYTYLFPLFEELIQNQSPKVRKKAIEKYKIIIESSGITKCEKEIMLSIKNINEMQYDEAKEAIAAIVASFYGHFNQSNRQNLIICYTNMIQSQSICLRKFAAMYSSKLVQWLEKNQTVILKIVETLFKDKQQANKIYMVDTLIQLAKYKSQTLHQYFNLISYQFTWRIRYELISKTQAFAAAMGKQNFSLFVSFYVKYLNDIQPEIRSVAYLKLKDIANYLEAGQIIKSIMPVLKNAHQDSHAYVRNSLANSLLYLCPIIGKKNTNQFILPKFLHLLKDQDQKVRLTVFKNIDLICKTLGIETLSQSTMPALTELMAHSNWRIRVQSIDIYFYFIKEQGAQFMNEKTIKQCLQFIRDKAYKVREAGIRFLVNILKHFGNQWFEKNFLIKITQICKATSYLQRQTALATIQALVPDLSPEAISRSVITSVLLLCEDEIANVRLSACKVLRVLYKLEIKQKQAIKKCIRTLKNDKDSDVSQMAISVQKSITG